MARTVVPLPTGLVMCRSPPIEETRSAISVRPWPEGFAPPGPLSCISTARNSAAGPSLRSSSAAGRLVRDGRTWHVARQVALGPELDATALARRPYNLRHAALSLWLNATGASAEVAARAGNSAGVLHDVYLHCIDSQQDHLSQQIEDALDADASNQPSSQWVKASGYTDRRLHHRPCPLYPWAPGVRITGRWRPSHAAGRMRQVLQSRFVT
jgi:hypothetical protein